MAKPQMVIQRMVVLAKAGSVIEVLMMAARPMVHWLKEHQMMVSSLVARSRMVVLTKADLAMARQLMGVQLMVEQSLAHQLKVDSKTGRRLKGNLLTV